MMELVKICLIASHAVFIALMVWVWIAAFMDAILHNKADVTAPIIVLAFHVWSLLVMWAWMQGI